jgi:predicted Holliday junction resolvase-like endonuclease
MKNMNNGSLAIICILGFLLFVSIIAVAVIAYRYASLKGQIAVRVKDEVQAWHNKEIEAVRTEQRDIALREAETQLTAWKEKQEQLIRQDAIQRSLAVTVGKVTEHFIPYLPDFSYNPKDARFIGSPIDFIVFDGLNDGTVKNIVFIEFKTGDSVLSAREKWIRDAIQSGRVLWKELRYTRVESTNTTTMIASDKQENTKNGDE